MRPVVKEFFEEKDRRDRKLNAIQIEKRVKREYFRKTFKTAQKRAFSKYKGEEIKDLCEETDSKEHSGESNVLDLWDFTAC